jgi:dTDP-4-dehydrorhamnose reductase
LEVTDTFINKDERQNMKLLVLGATGFLGSKLLELSTKHNNLAVYGTSRHPNNKFNILQVDVINDQSIEETVKIVNPDIVIWTLMDSQNETDLTDKGLVSLLSVINKETKLIYMSTDAVFVKGEGNYKESDPIGFLPKGVALSIYVNAKNKAENLIRSRHSKHIIIRTGPIYGVDSYQNIEKRILRIIKQIEKKHEIEVPSNLYRTFVDVEDLANAIFELSMIEFAGTIHIGPPQIESYYSIYKKRLEQLGQYIGLIRPFTIFKEDNPYISLDTSLNTSFARQLLKTHFRTF